MDAAGPELLSGNFGYYRLEKQRKHYTGGVVKEMSGNGVY